MKNLTGRSYLVPLAMLCCAAYPLIAGRGASVPGARSQFKTRGPAPARSVPRTNEAAAHERETQERIDELARQDVERSKRDRAAARMQDAHKDLQYAANEAWSALLTRHWQAFQALREKAAETPDRTTPCNLCDGQGHMQFCILCRDNSGKCVTCAGTGNASLNEYCPACLGTGKCHLCLGAGKMACPFCDEGVIDLKFALPPNLIPVD